MSDMTNDAQNTGWRGLTEDEVNERVEQGLINQSDISTGKSVKNIILSNILTYFNLIFLIIAILLIYVGSYRNLTFLPVIIGNIVIGIVQELRAKQILDKMNLINAPHSIVFRNGVQKQILSQQLVKDDIVLLSAGNQICADAIVVEGNIQVNEALLTGEADEIEKISGSSLLSGSFVVSGQCYAKLEHVGNDSYITKLTAEAKAMGSGEQSEMIRSINQLVKWIGIGIIPIGILLFSQGYYMNHETMQKSIVSMVAAIIGMIPEGLYLLTTIALALSTMRLAKNQVILHDMKSIEALARVDVLCVDKTGTITEPGMEVLEIIPSKVNSQVIKTKEELELLLADYAISIPDDNATMHAIREYVAAFDTNSKKRETMEVIPFSSTTKYSGISFSDGSFLLGAPEFIMREEYPLVLPEISTYIKNGHRVLLLGKYEGTSLKDGLSEKVVPMGYIILTNPIRENARETFSYFKEQGVCVKVISGDNPETVSEVAKRAGIEHADQFIDAGTLDTDSKLASALEEYTVFGRVTPKQKQKLVQALQKAGHTVAMTGDGVNDILAMKDADCSVAMASGSEAAAQAAQVVLLDSDFAHMPNVVIEGRRVVNNVQRSAVLFLVKNIFSILLALLSLVISFTYPLEPSQISLISMFTIGFPGFLLALEPNKNRIKGHFLKNVLIKALPAGLTDVLAVGALVVCGEVFSLPKNDIATASTMLLSVVGFMILTKISAPLNPFKNGIIIFNILGLVFCGIFLHQLFAISEMSNICVLLLIVFSFAAESLFRYLTIGIEKLDELYRKIRQKKQ
ncbi:cation-transporting ATPase E [Lacrimispora xylanisolvens]|uniref:Cation-transporting ATPase E n=1 Tax=Lacrimispora xylanisolvens TaxID=384636 RepID=A0A2S6HTS1_9FIRM|nr:cation-transporting ATPase E [Hungatella xylanolytica]